MRGATMLDRPWEKPSASDWATDLAELPLLSRLRRGQLRRLVRLAEFKEFVPGDVIIQAGDRSDAFFLILGGQARVLGARRARQLRRGDYFGEMGPIDGEPRSASIVAASELQVMKLPRQPFLKLLERNPKIALAMLAELSGRVRRLERSAAA
jgi:CRP/FNR family transcriptional regulator/CRP/FNR family cyclic AMP-dependent transcriptional regulator